MEQGDQSPGSVKFLDISLTFHCSVPHLCGYHVILTNGIIIKYNSTDRIIMQQNRHINAPSKLLCSTILLNTAVVKCKVNSFP